eukprot:XP_001691521.1 predicted protein [Chlamydomonas reinhardtii]
MSLFTEDARQAMTRLQQYAAYVEDEVCPREEACGEVCTENREVLEKAWQAQPDGLIRTKPQLQAAIAAMLARLHDPYSEFLPPAAFRRALRRPLPSEQSYLQAQYVGLGVELGPVAAEGGRLVLAPLAGSPAEASGIARGDRLISIDGTRVDELGLEQARALMRGPAGSSATLDETTTALAAALSRSEPDPANVGYVLDLRNNPGGVFEEALACASFFLDQGDVLAKTIRGPEEVIDTVGSLPEEVFPSLPGRLAAKPVFAGALRDNGRAPLVGEPTFGKGLVQYYFPLRDGNDGGVRVTVAKYLTPSGYDISGRGAGLVPDRACSDFPHGGLPTSVDGGDKCIQAAAGLLRPCSPQPEVIPTG